MAQIKICPHCGTHNSPDTLECTNCEYDLSNVQISDENAEAAHKAADNVHEAKTETSAAGDYVRICDSCGHVNPANIRKCVVCKEDISNVDPILQSNVNETKARLVSIDGKYVFDLPIGDTVIGREKIMHEYLSAKPFVSRTHCKFSVENNNVSVENISETNGTFVNNVRIFEKTILQCGDEIGLGGKCCNGEYTDMAAFFRIETK